MSDKINGKEYSTLLEQAVKDLRSPTSPPAGLDYEGMPVDGDDNIINWDGGEQKTHRKVTANDDDIDELVEAITKEEEEKKEENLEEKSPLSVVEGDDASGEVGDEQVGGEGGIPDIILDKKVEMEVEEGTENIEDVEFEDSEAEILSRLIKEMKSLEENDFDDELDIIGDEGEEIIEPELDLNVPEEIVGEELADELDETIV